MDRLDELVVFTTILETGSLAAAGRKLRRSPPAITRVLASLEERVGARLLQRTTRQLVPTAAGRRLASHARQLLGEYDQTVGAANEDRSAPLQGLLRITAPSPFGRLHVVSLVARFLEKHPDLSIEMVLSNRHLDLVEEGLDVAVRIGRLSKAGLIARRVGHVHVVACASPDYIVRHGRPRTPQDLARHEIVDVSVPPRLRRWRFRISGREQFVRLTPRFTVTEVDAMLAAARAGVGIVRAFSYQVSDDFSSGALVRLLPEFEPPPVPVHLVIPSARHMPRSVRAFIDHAAPAFNALRAIHE